MNTTNWVQAGNGERYGSSEIYCYEHEFDALKGAARMDWDFNKSIGSGKISIIEFSKGKQSWEQDNNDPMTQFGRTGMRLKSNESVRPEQIIKIYPFTQDMAKSLIGRTQ